MPSGRWSVQERQDDNPDNAIHDRRCRSGLLRFSTRMTAEAVGGYFAISPTTIRFGGLTITILSISLTNL